MTKNIKRQISRKAKQSGFSLLELLIAMTIGLLLLSGILVTFTASHQSYRVTENTSRLQENARLAFEILARDIRMAGYMGCFSNVAAVNNLPNTATAPSFSTATVMQGQSGADFTDGAEGTDAFTARRAAATGAYLTGNMATDNGNIQLGSNPYDFQADDILFISDCSSADIFCANNVSAAAGKTTISHSNACNSDPKLSKAYGPDAQIMAFVQNSYFIRINPVSGEPALSRVPWNRDDVGNAEELVEGVYDMQLLYGVDTDADEAVNSYQDAATITAAGNWPNVISVRVTISLRTLENGTSPQAQTYTVDGVAVTDNRIRKNFTSTIALRNRLP